MASRRIELLSDDELFEQLRRALRGAQAAFEEIERRRENTERSKLDRESAIPAESGRR